MKAKRRMEIRLETRELIIIRFPPSRRETFCAACGKIVSHFTVGQTAFVLSLSETAIFRLAESSRIHSTESAAGSLLLCGNSLAALAKNK